MSVKRRGGPKGRAAKPVIDPQAVDPDTAFELARGAAPRSIVEHFAVTPYEGPRVGVDLALVEGAYQRLSDGLHGVQLYYAVKANPNPEILKRLRDLGAGFDVASRGEIDRCLSLGIEASRLSFGNTVKREVDIAHAYAKGVRLFAFDAAEELEKLARAAPGSEVFCRLLVQAETADWPLSRKFGCSPEMAEGLLLRAAELGLSPVGLSFHVGSQMRDPGGWRPVLLEAALVWKRLSLQGLKLSLLNIGGGFPARYGENVPPMDYYARRVRGLIAEVFGRRSPARIIAEPGRGMVAEAGVIEAEVVLVSRKSEEDPLRWVYLDVGKFGGLAETMEEAIRYRMLTAKDGGEVGPCVLAGPTCDSADVMYEKAPVMLPLDLAAGDRVLLPCTGAYTTTYAAIWFNGIDPLREVVIDSAAAAAETAAE